MYAHSDEVEELAVVNLKGVNLEKQEQMEQLLGVRCDTLYAHGVALTPVLRNALHSHYSRLLTPMFCQRRMQRSCRFGLAS